MKSIRVYPCSQLKGTIQVPGDKSISHRAVMLAGLAEGKSRLRGLLLSEDVKATINCFRAMGVEIQIHSDEVTVEGVGLYGLKAPSQVLDCGNSGTTLRLMMGILSAQPFTSRLTGDESLNRRPVERVAAPLRQMGAQIEELRASPTERVVKITGKPLQGIHYRLPMASAQVKSAILLAGLYAAGTTQVEEPMPSRDHTELMLQYQGVALQRSNIIQVSAVKKLKALDLDIPGDISSAAFFLVAGALGQGSEIFLKGVGVNPTRTGILDVLQAMGAQVETLNSRQAGGEAVADLLIRSSSLKGSKIAGALIPRLIDEIPILSVAAAAAQGVTEIRDATELRVKETDRIASIEKELKKLGVPVQTYEDGLSIQGPNSFHAAQFESYGDHRIAMSMAIAATQAEVPSLIQNIECVDTSYPGFFRDLESLGVRIESK